MAAKIPFGSVEYLHVPITRDEDSTPVDLTKVGVEVAILSETADPSAPGVAWSVATVVGDAQEVRARHLLDGTTLRGRYAVWVRLTAIPEAALRKAGTLTVY